MLVVGAGEISALTAQHLRSQGVGDIAITSRTTPAPKRWRRVDGRAVAGHEMDTAVAGARHRDLRHRIAAADHDARTSWRRSPAEARRDPLFIIDIAVPRDVDPAVGEIEQVFLYNVDDLQGIVQENISRRGAEIQRAEAHRQRGTGAVQRVAAVEGRDPDGRGAAPTVRLHPPGRAAAPRKESSSTLPRPSRARVDEVTRLIVEKLLLEPTEQLKAAPDEETQTAYTEAVIHGCSAGEDDANEPAAGCRCGAVSTLLMATRNDRPMWTP